MKKMIVALDVKDRSRALSLVEMLSPYVDIFKVGPILFLTEGPSLVREIKQGGNEVFLDLKFHDIPQTVRRSVESAAELGVYSLTLHSSGGEVMMREAASVPNRPRIWAVTVLTSQQTDPVVVRERALMAKKAGVDGVISSPHEIEMIKLACGNDFGVITPGIRMNNEDKHDQKRIATPGAAVRAGANFIVVGRPVIEAVDPIDAAKRITEEIEKALGGK